MSTERFKTDQIIPYEVKFEDVNGDGITTAAGKISIRRTSTDTYWNGATFQAAEFLLTMDEFDPVNSPGFWRFNFDLSVGDAIDNYVAQVSDSNGNAVNKLEPRLDFAGDYIDPLETTIDTVDGKVDVIDTNVDTVNTTTSDTNSKVDIIDTNVDTINAVTADTNSKVDIIDVNVDTVNATTADTNAKVDIIDANVDTININTADTNAVVNAQSDNITKILGLVHQNFVLDPTEFSTDNEMTKGDVRIYDTAANATTDDKVTGLLFEFSIDAPRINGMLDKFTQILS